MTENTERQSTEAHALSAEVWAINEQLIIAGVRQQELVETATQKAESAFQRLELYRLMARNYPNGMVLLFDHDLRHILADGRGLLALGLSKESLEGRTIWEGFEPQTCRQIEPAYRAALAGRTTILEIQFLVEMPLQEERDCLYQLCTLPVMDDLGNVLTGMAVAQDVTEQRQAEEATRWQAHHDALTRLPNRVLLRDRLDQLLAMAERSGEVAALLFLDLDHFKSVNDALGHTAGDRLLETVAARLTGCLRTEDTVARMGGDEFVVLLPSVQSAENAAQVALKIAAALAVPVLIDNHEISVTASVGVSLFPTDGRDALSLMTHADGAMYRSKQDRRGHDHDG